jgi:hypothetical protein
VSILHRPTRPAGEDSALLDGHAADPMSPDPVWADPMWDDVLSRLQPEAFRTPESEPSAAGLCCRWEPDPGHPGRMRSVWSPGPSGQ